MSNKVISFHYTLTNAKGEKLDSSEGRDPLTYLSGKGQIISALDSELQKMKTGEKKRVEVKADAAYGERDEKRCSRFPATRCRNRTSNWATSSAPGRKRRRQSSL